MTTAGYHYFIEIAKADGSTIGWIPVRIDWEPAVEDAYFQHQRKHGLPPEPGNPGVEPVFFPESKLYMSGFQVSIPGGNGDGGYSFTTSYFKNMAMLIANQLVNEGHLKNGDYYRYGIIAVPEDQMDPTKLKDESMEKNKPTFTIEKRRPDMVLIDTPHNEMLENCEPTGLFYTQDYPVIIPMSILKSSAILTRIAGSLETGGIFIGHLYRDPESREILAKVTTQIPLRHAQSELTSLKFTDETWCAVRSAIKLRNRNEIMLGWWHSHSFLKHTEKGIKKTGDINDESKSIPDEGVLKDRNALFMSFSDRILHRTVFPRAYSIALVISDCLESGITMALYGWRKGEIHERGFYIRQDDESVVSSGEKGEYEERRGENVSAV